MKCYVNTLSVLTN